MRAIRPARQLHSGGRWFHGAPIVHVDWDPRGRLMLSASAGAVRVWWAATGELVRSLPGIGGDAKAKGRFVFLAGGRRIAGCVTTHNTPVLRFWDTEGDGGIAGELAERGRGAIIAVDRSRRLAVTCSPGDNAVSLVDLEAAAVVARFDTSEAAGPIAEDVDVLAAAIRHDGARVFLHRRNSVPEIPGPLVTETLELWNAQSESLLVRKSPARESSSAVWDQRGKRILVGGEGTILDGETLQPLGRLDQVPGSTQRLETDATGARLLAAHGRLARFYADLVPDPRYVAIAGPAVAFDPAATRLLSGGEGGVLQVTELASGKTLNTDREIPQSEYFIGGIDRRVSFTRDGRVLAVDMGSSFAFHDATTLEITRTAEWARATEADKALFRAADPNATPDGSLAATYLPYDRNRDGEPHGVIVFGTAGPMSSLVHQITDGRAGPVAVAPDGQLAVSGHSTTTLRVWDLATAIELRTLRAAEGIPAVTVGSIAFSVAGAEVAVGDESGALSVWRVGDGSRSRHHHEPGGPPVRALAFGTEGRIAVGRAGSRRNLTLLDASGTVIAVYEGHASDVTSIAFHPDGKHLVSAGRDRCVMVWELPDK